MQSNHDLSRLLQAAPGMAGRIVCGGNLKFDIGVSRPSRQRLTLLMKVLAIRRNNLVLVAGSTHRGEEKFLFTSFRHLRAVLPELRFIVAPRDPKRSTEVKKLAESMDLGSCIKSEGCSTDAGIIIIDTLGELSEIYALAHIAFVGGSLVPTGGHNLFEPAAHGIPVLWGPYTESCMDMAEILKKGCAGTMTGSRESFERTVLELGTAGEQRRAMGRAAYRLVKRHGGSVKKYLELTESVLDPTFRLSS
jgi:3-deoxy-D-manno-octulosonic-acid transferase